MNAHDDEEAPQSQSSIPLRTHSTPSSPPPSFRSRSSSPSRRRLLRDDPHDTGADDTLAAAFGDGSDSEADDEPDDRQRLMRAQPDPQPVADSNTTTASASSSGAGSGSQSSGEQRTPAMQRRPTILPSFNGPGSGSGRTISSSNDGVFANLAAKPERGEKNEDMPPV